MKKIYTLAAVILITISLLAQSPQKMSYQAVVRNSSNNLVTNQAVGMKVSILKDSITGTAVYEELYNPNPTTNANGLVTVEIGGGVPLFGVFSAIDWSAGSYFIKTETDPTGGTNYSITGATQLMSVPYALHAKTADSITGEGRLVSQGGKVVRDFLTWSDTSTNQNATPIHIKTNIPENSNVMYRILVEGYAFGPKLDINSVACGYTYSTTGGIQNKSANNYASGVSISQYISTDNFVVIKLTATNTYHLMFSASVWFLNRWYNPSSQISPSFQISGTVIKSTSNL